MNMHGWLLAIESSCDDTSAALFDESGALRSLALNSQDRRHGEFGGVVPELASRMHYEKIDLVVQEALCTAGIELNQVAAVGVTRLPGLIGSLLVGLSYAKGLAWSRNIPLIDIHHIEGHIWAPALSAPLAPPFLCMVISGGHTSLYQVNGFGDYHLLARTLDDAAGEAFDKVGKMLGLQYPGGPRVDALAARGQASVQLPEPRIKHHPDDFSFSGLKTAVLNHLQRHPETAHADIAASFNQCVAEILVGRALRFSERTGIRRLAFSGGVSCNSALRRLAARTAEQRDLDIIFPEPIYCTDNAAMIGKVAFERWRRGDICSSLDINAVASNILAL